jgi:uncharacterized membrane protein YgcG
LPRAVPSRPDYARILRVILFIVVGTAFIPFSRLGDVMARLSPRELPARPAGRVFDDAAVLSAPVESELERISADLDRATGAELAVATVKSLGGEEVSKYAFRLFTAWGVGKKGRDNGVLILVAPKEHKVWIATGYGVEGSLPDGLCGEISRQAMIPRFRANDYDSGTLAGARRVAAILAGRDTAPSGTKPADASGVSANIYDEAGMLDAETRSTVSHYIRILKEKAGIDLFLVTVPTTGDKGAEEAAKERAAALGLPSGKGLLVLVSRQGNEVAVEASPGLASGEVLDGLRKAVTSEIVSALKSGNILGAFWSGVARVWRVFGEEGGKGPREETLGTLVAIGLFLSVFILVGGFLSGAGLGSRAFFLLAFGAFFAGIPFFAFSASLLGALRTAWLPVIHALLGAAAFYGGLKVGHSHPKSFRGSSPSGSGWVWGGGSSGGGFGGGGGGGFGGGSSGGGGGGGSW